MATRCCFCGRQLFQPFRKPFRYTRPALSSACARNVSGYRKHFATSCFIYFLRTTRGTYKFSQAMVEAHNADRETSRSFRFSHSHAELERSWLRARGRRKERKLLFGPALERPLFRQNSHGARRRGAGAQTALRWLYLGGYLHGP